MHGGLPHRPGYAVVPQLKPGVVRRAIALRGTRSRRATATTIASTLHGRASGDRKGDNGIAHSAHARP